MVLIKSPYPTPPPAPDTNLHHALFNAPGQDTQPDYVLHIDGITGRKQTWYEFRELVRDGATAIASTASSGGLGLDPKRDLVGIFSHNCINYVALANALLATTVPFAPLSSFSTPYELAHLLRTSDATCVFVDPHLLPQLLAAAREVGLPTTSIHILEGSSPGHTSFQDLVDNVRQRGLTRIPVEPATKNTLAYLVFSSGTTGLPKAVMTSHGNVLSVLLSVMTAKVADDQSLKLPPSQEPPITLLCLPFYHAYGIFASLVRPFSLRGVGVILPKWDVNATLRVVPRYGITILPLVPSMIHQMVHHPDFPRTDFSSVKSFSSGAARLPPALEAQFRKFIKNSAPPYGGYGSSEVTLTVARKFPPGCLGLTVPPNSVGVLFPGVEAKIVRPDGTEAGFNEPGELWARGPNVCLGYYNNEKATRETFVDGWVRMGDTLTVDEQGMLYFVDRSKDTLKVGGTQVSPTEIEDVLMAHPDKLIVDACVAGVSGGRTSDEKIPRAWVVLSEEGKRRGAAKTLKALDAWVLKNLSKYKRLRGGLQVVDEVPKNPTGKMLRRVLQEEYERGKVSAKL